MASVHVEELRHAHKAAYHVSRFLHQFRHSAWSCRVALLQNNRLSSSRFAFLGLSKPVLRLYEHPVHVTKFQLLPAGLTFTNPTFCPHNVFICFVWISEQTAIISLLDFMFSIPKC